MMSMHDRYYEPEDGEDLDEEIAKRMKYENNPFTEENILEAIANDALVKCIPTLSEFLMKGDKEKAGLVLSATLFTYWEDRTRDEIQSEY